MAEESSVVTQQQKATLQSTESHLLKVSSVKRLGYYSKNELTELRALFTELLAALNTSNTGFYELFDNQKITEARIEKTGPTALTTDAGLPGDATSDKRKLLFFADWVALVLDIAHVLQEHYPSQTLEYVALQDTESFLKDWGSEADGKISQISLQYESAQNVVELLSNVSRQFDYLAQTESEQEEDDDEDTEDSENTDESKPTDATDEDDDWSSSANRVQTQKSESGEAEAPTPYAEDVEIDREDTSVRKDIATEVTWVFNAARVNLLQQFLDEAGIDPNNLPPALRARLTSLEDALRDELYRITGSLSDADLRQLLNHRFRLSLYRQLLTNILANPANPFYTELLQFYKEFTKTTVQTAEPDVQADVIRQFEVAFAGVDSTDAENKALQAIHQEVQTWIAQLRREFAITRDTEPDETDQAPDADPKQQKTDETTDTDQILTQTDVALVPSVPPAKNAFSATQTKQLTNSFETVVSLPAAERRALQNQSARLVWGAAAEIFGDTSNLPPQLIDIISGHAVDYLLTLSPEELIKLSKSPISLLNRIPELSRKVRQDVRFQVQVEQLGTFRQNPEVSRTELLEREIEVGYQTIVDAIFYQKGITEYTLAQEPKLVAEFESIKEYIRQELYVELSELSIEELQALVSDMASQEQFLARFEQELIGDNPQLSRVLRAFLRRYIAHMTATGQLREADAAQRILLDVSSGFELAETPEARRERVRTERTEEAGTAEITSRQILQTSGPQTEEPETTSEGQALIQTSSEAVRKKKSLLNNLLENEWKQLSHEEKVAVYLHYDYPVPKKFRQSNPDLQQSNQYFVLVPEFLELDRQNLLPILVHNLTHPPDGKAELALDAPLTADRISKLHAEKEISDRALNTQLETAATQIADPDTHRRLVQYVQLQEEQRQTIFQQIIMQHQAELQEIITAYEIDVQNIKQEQLAILVQEIQAQETANAVAQLEASNLDSDPELSGNFTGWRKDLAQVMNVSSRTPSAKEALQKKLLNRFTPSQEQLAKKGIQQLATRLGAGAVAAPLAAGMVAYSLLQDPRTRDMLVGGLGYMTALALQAFSNLAGLVTFLGVTGAVAFIPGLGFLAIPAGLAAGGLAASLFPNAPSLLGIRMPPAPWSELSQSGPGLREMRAQSAAESSAQAEAAEAAQASNAAEASRASSAANAQAARAQAAAEAASEGGGGNGNGAGQTPAELSVQGSATAAATSSTTSSFFGLPIWGFTTISAFTLVFLLSWSVILVIMGAFIAPVPTRIADYAGTDPINAPTQSQYVTILKTASPAKIENLSSGETALIEYTITIQPKADYTLDLRSVKDTISGFGDVVPDLSVYNGALTTEDLPTDRVVDPVSITYSIEYSGTITDALVNNSALFSMTVYDAYDYPVKQNETVTAVGSVRVGNPTIGCWPTDGDIWQLPGGDFSHDSPYLDAYDIANKIGTPVYAPFPGEYCDRGLDTAASGGYGRHGSLQISLNSGGEERILTFYFGHFINGAPIPGLDSRKCKQVAAGELIGLMDDTGYSKGSHLHFELRPNPYGIKLVDLMQGGRQVNAAFNAGEYPPVEHCFNRN